MPIKLSALKVNPANPRLIKDAAFRQLVESIRDFPKMMELRPIVIDEASIILAGTQRRAALKELGYKEIPEAWVKRAADLTAAEKKEFILKDNLHAGEWDLERLANDWDPDALKAWGLEIPGFHFGTGEEEPELTAQEDNYIAPEDLEDIQTDIVLGDLFEIGPHRLLCGDNRVKENVLRLLDGAAPYVMATDPPYGVKYDANWRNEAKRPNGKPIGAFAVGKVNNDHNNDWTETWALSPAKVAYVYHAGLFSGEVQLSLERTGFEIRSQIVWVKSNFAISRGHFHWKHEPLWYAVRKGARSNWIGDRKQTTVWEIPKPARSESGHSTQKPVECMARPLRLHGGDVYDPFIGSGSTMVAAHQLRRRCFALDNDPKWIHVTVTRMLLLDPAIEIRRNGKPYLPPA